MAHSFIKYRTKSVMFRDADVFLIIGVARHVATHERYQLIVPMLDAWFFGYDEFPSGAIDLQLDTHLANQETYKLLAQCVDDAITIVRKHGSILSGTWLSEVLNDGDRVEYKDRAGAGIIDVLERFKSLLI